MLKNFGKKKNEFFMLEKYWLLPFGLFPNINLLNFRLFLQFFGLLVMVILQV
jgi:hypothetical protein